MDIRVINLDRAADRKASVEAQFRTFGLEGRFVSAVDGRDHDLERLAPFLEFSPFLFRPLKLGEVGCFASHYGLWQECLAARKPMLILEDDCIFHAGIKDVIAALPGLLEVYPFLRLAGSNPRAGKALRKLPDGRSLVRLDEGPLGTLAYAIAPTGAQRLIRHAAVWSRPVDSYIDAFWVHGLLPLAVQPYPLLTTQLFPSTIADTGRVPTRWSQRRLARFSRKLYRHIQRLQRLLFKLGTAWQ